MKTLYSLFLISVIGICFCGCNDGNEEGEVYPIRFADNSYEVRLKQTESISFVDGSGDYTIRVDNPEILEATINSDSKSLLLHSKQKGETEITIIDNKAKGEVRLNMKVVDSYLGFMYTDGNIPLFPMHTNLYLVNSESQEFYIFKQMEYSNVPEEECVLKGNYAIKYDEASFSFRLLLTIIKEENQPETHTYNITGSSNIYTLMKQYLGLQIPAIDNALTKSINRPIARLSLQEQGGKWAFWDLITAPIPKGVLK